MSSALIKQQVHFKCTGQEGFSRQLLQERNIQYHFLVKGSVAYHELQLSYNNSKSAQSLKFQFCLTEDTCFDHLSIKIGEEVIDCLIKEKEEAKSEYEDAIQSGKQAALGQLNDGRGYFSIDIGNVQLDQDFQITFKYIEQLVLSGEEYRMTLPFEAKSNERKFDNLDILGDIISQTENDNIYMTKLNNCVDNPSIKFTQITNHHTQFTGSFSNYIVLSTNQDGFNIGQLSIRYSSSHLTLLSSFQNDSEISPYCALVNFVPHLVSVKNSLQIDNAKMDEIGGQQSNLIKSEFILLIDRSGSMSGSRIKTAKESLIFFLKSLPIGSIYNIISFGTKYKMMYDCSVQLNDANLQESINQIQEFSADMAGTNIAMALEDIFSSLQDQYGLRKKVYILTDGEFNDHEPALKVVKLNQVRCDINVLCIGSDCSFEYAKTMAQLTGGYTQTVSSPQDIVPKVIQLLSDSFQNFDGISMNLLSDHDECINYIVPNPQSIQYIDTTKTLRFYIFFNRKFEEANQIKFKLTTTYKGNKDIQDNFVIDLKSQVSNDQAHLHKMGLYQLIRQLAINQQRKSENISDDIQIAINQSQNEMKELFKNEAIRYQILCEYTAFVGVSQIKKVIKVNPYEPRSQELLDLLNKSKDLSDASQHFYKSSSYASNRNSQPIKLGYYSEKKQAAGCCGGGGGGGSTYYHPPSAQIQNAQNKKKEPKKRENAYNEIITSQSAQGIWSFSSETIFLLNLDEDFVKQFNPIDKTVPNSEDIWMTLIISYWLQQFYKDRLNQHQYVLLKAHGFTDRVLKQYSLSNPEKELKELFQGYDPQSVSKNPNDTYQSVSISNQSTKNKIPKKIENAYNEIIFLQSARGTWQCSADIIFLLNLDEDQIKRLNPIDKTVPDHEDIWMTFIVAYWLQQFYKDRAKIHSYVLLKALGITDKVIKDYSINNPEKQLKELFSGYDPHRV